MFWWLSRRQNKTRRPLLSSFSMEPWLKYNYYCSFRSVLHDYKIKKDVFEAYFIYTKWKTSLWSILHLYKVRKSVLETFFIVTDKKKFSKRFAYLQNEKTRFWMLHLCKMTNTFWNRFTFRAMKKARLRIVLLV